MFFYFHQNLDNYVRICRNIGFEHILYTEERWIMINSIFSFFNSGIVREWGTNDPKASFVLNGSAPFLGTILGTIKKIVSFLYSVVQMRLRLYTHIMYHTYQYHIEDSQITRICSVYIRTYAYTHEPVYTNMHLYVHICIISMCTHLHITICIYACVHTYIYFFLYVLVHIFNKMWVRIGILQVTIDGVTK